MLVHVEFPPEMLKKCLFSRLASISIQVSGRRLEFKINKSTTRAALKTL